MEVRKKVLEMSSNNPALIVDEGREEVKDVTGNVRQELSHNEVTGGDGGPYEVEQEPGLEVQDEEYDGEGSFSLDYESHKIFTADHDRQLLLWLHRRPGKISSTKYCTYN